MQRCIATLTVFVTLFWMGVKGALLENAAFADSRLAGKRSQRVEELCQAHDGKGSPCDFVSIHAYNGSEMMAAKLTRAKEMALEIDEDFYADLWVNSHEACPEWNLPPDEAASDSYRGNGFFPTWCVDVAGRQLRQAASSRSTRVEERRLEAPATGQGQNLRPAGSKAAVDY